MISITVVPILPPANYFGKKGVALQAAIVAALQSDVAGMLSKALRERTSNWSKSPRWSAKISVGGNIILTMKPTGDGAKLWAWVSGGTKPHAIDPRRKKVLSFGSGYVPKTLKGGTYGQAGVYIGDSVIAHHVDHPGIEARNFEEDVKNEKEDDVVAAIAAAVESIAG